MKNIRLFIAVIWILSALVGCAPKSTILDEVEETLESYAEWNNITEDTNLPTQINGVEITWQSSNPQAMSNLGVIQRLDEDRQVILYAYLKYEGRIVEKEIQVTIRKQESDIALALQDVFDQLDLDATISEDVHLPTFIDGVMIYWSSSKEEVLTSEGNLYQGFEEVSVVLTAVLEYGQQTLTKEFHIVAMPMSPEESIEYVLDSIVLPEEVYDNVTLPTEMYGVDIVWSSNHPAINAQGQVFREEEYTLVELTATASFVSYSKTKVFYLIVAKLSAVDEWPIYYDSAKDLTGDALKSVLHSIIRSHQSQTYASLWTYLPITDQDPDNSNNVILLYTGRSQSKYEHGGNQGQWNREHTWPKSHGGFADIPPMGTDLHHMRPTDVAMNGARGNLDFDEGGVAISSNYGPTSSYSYVLQNVSFEPRDEVKGDVARMMFYMATRYETIDAGIDLELNDRVQNGSIPYLGKLSTLLRWHLEDPVDEFEINRNEQIYTIQGNRNPFVDIPDLVEMIWGTENNFRLLKSDNEAPDIISLIALTKAYLLRKEEYDF